MALDFMDPFKLNVGRGSGLICNLQNFEINLYM